LREGAAAVGVKAVSYRDDRDGMGKMESDGKRSDSGYGVERDGDGLELEKLVANEVRQWRSDVDRERSTHLRQRRHGGASAGPVNAMDEVRSQY
jgi:hypothetical protein